MKQKNKKKNEPAAILRRLWMLRVTAVILSVIIVVTTTAAMTKPVFALEDANETSAEAAVKTETEGTGSGEETAVTEAEEIEASETEAVALAESAPDTDAASETASENETEASDDASEETTKTSESEENTVEELPAASEESESAPVENDGQESEETEASLQDTAGDDSTAAEADEMIRENNGTENEENNGAEETEENPSLETEEEILSAMTAEFTAGDDHTYEVVLIYSRAAGIPDGARLEVEELSENNEEYAEYTARAAEAIGHTEEALSYIKLLDISIVFEDEKIQPAVPVDVQIRLMDLEESAKEDLTQVVHFGEEEVEVIEAVSEGDTVSFEASGFSIYAVTSYQTATDLDGRSFAIVQVNTATVAISAENNTSYYGRALTSAEAAEGKSLKGTEVRVESHVSGRNIVTTSASSKVDAWTFTEAGGTNGYYISNADGQYLSVKNGSLTVSGTPQALLVVLGSGAYEGKVRIMNGTSCVRSSVSASGHNTSASPVFTSGAASNDYTWLTLCEIEEIFPDQYPVYTADKVSVQDLSDGASYLIYKTVFNPQSGAYEDWVIDGNGQAVRAYDQGNAVSLHSAVSPFFMLRICENEGTPTGYYIFMNEETGLCLRPMADGTLVAAFESDKTSGVALHGREHGEYTSTIEFWNGSAMAWYGYSISGESALSLRAVTGEESMAFSFAAKHLLLREAPVLHEVPTVDSAVRGITIKMYDYANRSVINNYTGAPSYVVGPDSVKNYVSKTLDKNGYPVSTLSKKSLAGLFGSSYLKGTANHLFLESIYNSTGYYEFSCFNNYAFYDAKKGEFTVYAETGTPAPTSNNFYYKRGNFMPYNRLNTAANAAKAQNLYNGNGLILDYENPNYGSALYGTSGTNNYDFGMTMDFNFLMPRDGLMDGSPLIYEFNGDDDLWIYIDGVLVLDIGGIHDAFSGSINFATGEVKGVLSERRNGLTIRDCFREAGVFPDGSAWDEAKASRYFDGETFVDYGSHSFKMFYLEHGEGASNLEMRFNMPVIEKGKVTVRKKLDNTSKTKYANVSFAYQFFAVGEGGDFEPVRNAVYENRKDADNNPVPVPFYDNVLIDGKTYSNVFYLKPEEAAVFSDLLEDEKYYVQELGIKSSYYDQVYINDVRIDGQLTEAEEGVYRAPDATVRERAAVTFVNHCDTRNSNELRITKRLSEGSIDNGDTFEFRVLLENAEGVLSPYYQGSYYICDDQGVYYRYENGALVSNGRTPYAATAGNYGTIEKIPAGYTVVITELLAGTDFYVDEIRVRKAGTPEEKSGVLLSQSGWEQVSVNVQEADPGVITDALIYDYETNTQKTGASMGSIAWGKDAEVVFTNRPASVIRAEKVWESGSLVVKHGDIQTALFTTDENGKLHYVEGSLRTIASPESSVEYRVVNPEGLTVREVQILDGEVIPVSEGQAIVVSGEDTKLMENADDTYIVSYLQGTIKTQDENGNPVQLVRVDTIVNRMPLLTISKTDADGNTLPGAVFRLLAADKETALEGLERLVSDDKEHGNLLDGFCLPNGVYYLQETEAPAGYNLLSSMLKITVDETGITMAEDRENGAVYEDLSGDDPLAFTFSVANTPGVVLPHTGGSGTSLLYVLGGCMTALSMVLLAIVKMRRKAEKTV